MIHDLCTWNFQAKLWIMLIWNFNFYPFSILSQFKQSMKWCCNVPRLLTTPASALRVLLAGRVVDKGLQGFQPCTQHGRLRRPQIPIPGEVMAPHHQLGSGGYQEERRVSSVSGLGKMGWADLTPDFLLYDPSFVNPNHQAGVTGLFCYPHPHFLKQGSDVLISIFLRLGCETVKRDRLPWVFLLASSLNNLFCHGKGRG